MRNAGANGGGGGGGQRDSLDRFYTKQGVARHCLARLSLERYARIVEPSAGAGAFSAQLMKCGVDNLVALDVAPAAQGIVRQNWFGYRVAGPKPTLVVGNPPFGRQGALAMRFLNHAFVSVEAQTVAFVVPRGFRKQSVKGRVFRNATLTHEELLPRDSFVLGGSDYSVSTVFQVWERTAAPRTTPISSDTSAHFRFVSKQEPHDFAVRRVGWRAGHASADTAGLSPNSNYFVRVAEGLDPVAVKELINELDFSVADDGTGPRSLSKRELVAVVDAGLRCHGAHMVAIGGAAPLRPAVADADVARRACP